ncbi:MAG: hypothetical protein OXI83_12985 [Gemmatimonadota bacterium]|nr:hypothetical protein [Gemmatimonadota bacterium]
MNGEIIAIITVGVALAGLNLTNFRVQRSKIAEFRAEINGIRTVIAALRERMAHLEGLREPICGRVGAGS